MLVLALFKEKINVLVYADSRLRLLGGVHHVIRCIVMLMVKMMLLLVMVLLLVL